MSCWPSVNGWVHKEKTKLEHITDPHNEEVVNYCLTLVAAKFCGETSNKVDNKSDMTQDEHEVNLGSLLQSMDTVIRERGHSFTGSEENFTQYLELVIKMRRGDGIPATEHRNKLMRDKEKFVQILNARTEPSEKLNKKHYKYWGTRQQLRFGKVVADWLEDSHENLDPIFGILLSPTGGRTGPGDASFLHSLLFDNNGPFAYHSAVHDAFGYLLTHHNTGPGYKYLDAASIFKRDNPLSEQAAGLRFWKKVLSHHRENEIEKKIY